MTPGIAQARMTAWLEHAWLVRYLDRELDGQEASWFEAYAMDKPELLAKIEADTDLRDALTANALMWQEEMETSMDSGASHGDAIAKEATRASPQARAESIKATGRWTRHSAWVALAASLVLGFGLGRIGTQSVVPSEGDQIVANPARVLLTSPRGANIAASIESGDSASAYVLVEMPLPDGAENATLEFEGQPLTRLAISADGTARFLVPRHAKKRLVVGTISYKFDGATIKHKFDLTSLR